MEADGLTENFHGSLHDCGQYHRSGSNEQPERQFWLSSRPALPDGTGRGDPADQSTPVPAALAPSWVSTLIFIASQPKKSVEPPLLHSGWHSSRVRDMRQCRAFEP